MAKALWVLAGLAVVAAALWLWPQGRQPHPPPMDRPAVAAPAPPVTPAAPVTAAQDAAVAPPVALAPVPTAPLAAGEPLTVTLAEPPALRYGDDRAGDADQHYRELVTRLSGGRAVYDPALSRAARELVYQSTELGDVVPSDVREFILRSAGAVAADTTFQQLRTTSDGAGPLEQTVSAVLGRQGADTGALHVGVGEVYRPGAQLPRHIGVIATRLGVELQPVDLRIAAGSVWRLQGRLTRPWRNLKALVLRQDGSDAELEVTQHGEAIAVDVPAGGAVGYLDVDLDGDGPVGPGKLVQVRAWVGRDPPRTYSTRVPADEAGLGNATDAEGWAFALLNADRQAEGLSPLQWDGQLAAIARRHSEDMRDHDFFAHQSPRTGLPADRLRAAGYRAPRSAENIALNSTLHEAEQGLLHSLGHRKNILSRDLTVAGIGVASRGEGKTRRWWLTQLFAKPRTAATVAVLEQQVADRTTGWRGGQGWPTPAPDPALAAVAREAAELAAAGQLDQASSRALELAKARGLVQGRMLAWALLTGEPGQFELPQSLRGPALQRWGVGIAAEAGPGDRHAVVVLAMP